LALTAAIVPQVYYNTCRKGSSEKKRTFGGVVREHGAVNLCFETLWNEPVSAARPHRLLGFFPCGLGEGYGVGTGVDRLAWPYRNRGGCERGVCLQHEWRNWRHGGSTYITKEAHRTKREHRFNSPSYRKIPMSLLSKAGGGSRGENLCSARGILRADLGGDSLNQRRQDTPRARPAGPR